MEEKTRIVNVVMYQDEKGEWKIALNLPEVPLNTKVMTPAESKLLARVLRGDIPVRRAPSRLAEIAGYTKRNVAEDLIGETANQLDGMGNLAEISQKMAQMTESGQYLI